MAGKKGRSGKRPDMTAAELDLYKENKAIATIGTRWKKRQHLFIALERLEVNYNWDEKEVIEAKNLIDSGRSLAELTEHFDRSENDLRILIMDLTLMQEIAQLPEGF